MYQQLHARNNIFDLTTLLRCWLAWRGLLRLLLEIRVVAWALDIGVVEPVFGAHLQTRMVSSKAEDCDVVCAGQRHSQDKEVRDGAVEVDHGETHDSEALVDLCHLLLG